MAVSRMAASGDGRRVATGVGNGVLEGASLSSWAAINASASSWAGWAGRGGGRGVVRGRWGSGVW